MYCYIESNPKKWIITGPLEIRKLLKKLGLIKICFGSYSGSFNDSYDLTTIIEEKIYQKALNRDYIVDVDAGRYNGRLFLKEKSTGKIIDPEKELDYN